MNDYNYTDYIYSKTSTNRSEIRIHAYRDGRYALEMMDEQFRTQVRINYLSLDMLYDIAHSIESYAQNEERKNKRPCRGGIDGTS